MKYDEIKKARKRAGLTQTDVAKAIGVTRNSYQRYEAGPNVQPHNRRIPSGEVMAKLIKFYQVRKG